MKLGILLSSSKYLLNYSQEITIVASFITGGYIIALNILHQVAPSLGIDTSQIVQVTGVLWVIVKLGELGLKHKQEGDALWAKILENNNVSQVDSRKIAADNIMASIDKLTLAIVRVENLLLTVSTRMSELQLEGERNRAEFYRKEFSDTFAINKTNADIHDALMRIENNNPISRDTPNNAKE